MKKQTILFLATIYIIVGCYLLNSFALNVLPTSTTEICQYGKIITNNANLLKLSVTPEDPSTTYFLLEETYFVKILSKINNDFYYVEYKDLTGYVKAENIVLVNENISSPYLENITFNIAKDCFLYFEPINNAKNQKIQLSKNQTMTYYGKIFADEITQNSGDVWYYCSLNSNGQKIFGYVHSSFTNNLSPIVPCTEFSTEQISQAVPINSILNLNLKTQTILTVVVSLPILFLIFLLLKGFKKV